MGERKRTQGRGEKKVGGRARNNHGKALPKILSGEKHKLFTTTKRRGPPPVQEKEPSSVRKGGITSSRTEIGTRLARETYRKKAGPRRPGPFKGR